MNVQPRRSTWLQMGPNYRLTELPAIWPTLISGRPLRSIQSSWGGGGDDWVGPFFATTTPHSLFIF